MTPQLPDLSNVPELPLPLTLLIVFLLLSGSVLTFIGALGLVCFRNFYDRLHMPALGTTLGMASILLGTCFYTSYLAGHLILRDIMLIFFLSLSAPITLMMLARPAAMRDLTQNWHDASETIFHRLVTNKTDEQTEREEKSHIMAETAAPALKTAGKTARPAARTARKKAGTRPAPGRAAKIRRQE